MTTPISRRDFLNGVALSLAAGAALEPGAFAADPKPGITSNYYPPTLTGMRGSHKGSYEAAHALVMGGQKPDQFAALDEQYDLVIVGGGISGLSAAYLYRKHAGQDRKVLILDNHDDFGGHAKRNEFEANGRMLLGFGGSINLEQQALSPTARQLLEELGVNFSELQAAVEPDYLFSDVRASYGLYLNKNSYGEDQIVAGHWTKAWLGDAKHRDLVATLKLTPDDQQKLMELVAGTKNYLPDVSPQQMEHYRRTTSYRTFLTERVGLSLAATSLLEPMLRAFFGVGLNCVSVAQALAGGCPGLKALGYTDQAVAYAAQLSDSLRFPLFPDGNASVARLLVRKLIPDVATGNSMHDLVASRFDYSKLDRETSPVRVRLNSTVLNVTPTDTDEVQVSYVVDGRAERVNARHCILACYNGMIPHLCPELPEAQKTHLKYGVKIPFVWTNVLLRNGEPVKRAGASLYQCPESFFEIVSTAPPVSLGDYKNPTDPSGPMVVFMAHMPAPKGDGETPPRDLYREGRMKLLSTPFETFEKEIKGQLSGMFGAHGFDADRDIETITVNRWSHGYAYPYMELYDPAWPKGEAPHELGRAQFGRISIANSDSQASPHVQGAMDAAWRAVQEQLKA